MFDIKKIIVDFVKKNDNKQVFDGYVIEPASLMKRFFAFFIDTILLTLFLSIILFSSLKNVAGFNSSLNSNTTVEERENEVKKAIEGISKNKYLILALFFAPVVYNIICLKFWKATIGQKLLKLNVVSESFNLTTRDIINRVCLFIICRANVIILVISYVLALYLTRKFTFYDIFSGTKVIEMKKIGE